jgi:hypothetical protein
MRRDFNAILGNYQTYKPLLLDNDPCGAAWSLRKLSSSYAGSAIRVRRSTDNVEQDIGFSGNDLDETALTTFLGSASGFVTTWYDQSGNGRNANQTTAANQPSIAIAGVINRDLGKACLSFNGTSHSFSLAAGSRSLLNDVYYASLIAVRKYASLPSVTKYILDIGTATGVPRATIQNTTGNSFQSNGRRLDGNANAGVVGGALTLVTQLTVSQFEYANAYLGIFINGVQTGTNAAFQTAGATSATDSSYILIALSITGGTTRFAGTMSELLVYNTNVTATRPQIENNINTYYGIY